MVNLSIFCLKFLIFTDLLFLIMVIVMHQLKKGHLYVKTCEVINLSLTHALRKKINHKNRIVIVRHRRTHCVLALLNMTTDSELYYF